MERVIIGVVAAVLALAAKYVFDLGFVLGVVVAIGIGLVIGAASALLTSRRSA